MEGRIPAWSFDHHRAAAATTSEEPSGSARVIGPDFGLARSRHWTRRRLMPGDRRVAVAMSAPPLDGERGFFIDPCHFHASGRGPGAAEVNRSGSTAR